MQAGLMAEPKKADSRKLSFKAFMIAACFGIACSAMEGPASADDENGKEDFPAAFASRFYGTVEKMPAGRFGTWVVGKRDVIVTKETRIGEKHGKAGVGAYVEVEGNNTGRIFTATRMEVKRSKMK